MTVEIGDADLDKPILSMSVNDVNMWMGAMHDALAAFKALDEAKILLASEIAAQVQEADDRLHDAFHHFCDSVHRQKHEAIEAAQASFERVRQRLSDYRVSE